MDILIGEQLKEIVVLEQDPVVIKLIEKGKANLTKTDMRKKDFTKWFRLIYDTVDRIEQEGFDKQPPYQQIIEEKKKWLECPFNMFIRDWKEESLQKEK